MFGVTLQTAAFSGVFELIFGILTRIKLFQENKGINAIIALVVALMSLQFGFVSNFFAQLFPRVGIGLAIILVILIVVGLFADPKSNMINYVLLGIGVIIVVVILVQAAGATGWTSGIWWSDNWETVIGILAILLIIGFVVGSSGSKKGKPEAYLPPWFPHKERGY